MGPTRTRPPSPGGGANRLTTLLVDSGIWIDHLRRPDLSLVRSLRDRRVRLHPFIIGELALGSLRDREAVIADLIRLRLARIATHDEVMALIERERLFARGIGYVDAHLLAATMLTPGARLWTRDRRLHAAAQQVGVAADVQG